MAKKTGFGMLDKRLVALEEADNSTGLSEAQESGRDLPKEVYVKPERTKVFSDGSVRTWDDEAQEWKIIQKR